MDDSGAIGGAAFGDLAIADGVFTLPAAGAALVMVPAAADGGRRHNTLTATSLAIGTLAAAVRLRNGTAAAPIDVGVQGPASVRTFAAAGADFAVGALSGGSRAASAFAAASTALYTEAFMHWRKRFSAPPRRINRPVADRGILAPHADRTIRVPPDDDMTRPGHERRMP
jgi:hypothetical protein